MEIDSNSASQAQVQTPTRTVSDSEEIAPIRSNGPGVGGPGDGFRTAGQPSNLEHLLSESIAKDATDRVPGESSREVEQFFAEETYPFHSYRDTEPGWVENVLRALPLSSSVGGHQYVSAVRMPAAKGMNPEDVFSVMLNEWTELFPMGGAVLLEGQSVRQEGARVGLTDLPYANQVTLHGHTSTSVEARTTELHPLRGRVFHGVVGDDDGNVFMVQIGDDNGEVWVSGPNNVGAKYMWRDFAENLNSRLMNR